MLKSIKSPAGPVILKFSNDGFLTINIERPPPHERASRLGFTQTTINHGLDETAKLDSMPTHVYPVKRTVRFSTPPIHLPSIHRVLNVQRAHAGPSSICGVAAGRAGGEGDDRGHTINGTIIPAIVIQHNTVTIVVPITPSHHHPRNGDVASHPPSCLSPNPGAFLDSSVIPPLPHPVRSRGGNVVTVGTGAASGSSARRRGGGRVRRRRGTTGSSTRSFQVSRSAHTVSVKSPVILVAKVVVVTKVVPNTATPGR